MLNARDVGMRGGHQGNYAFAEHKDDPQLVAFNVVVDVDAQAVLLLPAFIKELSGDMEQSKIANIREVEGHRVHDKFHSQANSPQGSLRAEAVRGGRRPVQNSRHHETRAVFFKHGPRSPDLECQQRVDRLFMIHLGGGGGGGEKKK